MCPVVAQRLTQITAPAATPDQLWQRVEAAWSAAPQEHMQSLFESMPRHVAAQKDLFYDSIRCHFRIVKESKLAEQKLQNEEN
ncbi:hypothetical protein TNCV_1107391 [Trichonephila clavipes]|nr:hypothetical protein TNCV_1107391 [Trichonephila clavipes]